MERNAGWEHEAPWRSAGRPPWAVALLCGVIALGSAASAGELKPLGVGDAVPDVATVDIEGAPLRTASYRDWIVVLSFADRESSEAMKAWMGDAQVFLRTATYNMDVAAFFTKWMVDVADAQTDEGVFPDTAPRLREGKNFVGLDSLAGAAGWADAGIVIPWTIWRVEVMTPQYRR